MSLPPTRRSGKLEASLKSCRKGRYAPPVHMIKVTATREITPIAGFIRTRSDGPTSTSEPDIAPLKRSLFHRLCLSDPSIHVFESTSLLKPPCCLTVSHRHERTLNQGSTSLISIIATMP